MAGRWKMGVDTSENPTRVVYEEPQRHECGTW